MEDQKTMETFAHEMSRKDAELREEQDRHSLTVRRWMGERAELRAALVEARGDVRCAEYERDKYVDWLASARKENRALDGEIAVYRAALEPFDDAHGKPEPYHRITLHDLRVAYEVMEQFSRG